METQQEEYIKCKGCKCRRHIDEYELYKGQRRKTCLKCKAKYERRRDKIVEYNKQHYQENKDKKKQQYQVNREEILEKRKQYRIDNKDKTKQYQQENRQKIAEQKKQYREKNKCKHNKFRGQCSICDPNMYLIKLQRGAVKRVLRQGNLTKTKHTIEYLGCSPEYFKEYLQKKMTDEMTFENIHIDHIKPVSCFNLNDEDEFLDCCHYTNLQPLLAQDNLEKKDKWSDENESYWTDNIKGKETTEIYFSWK